MRTLLAAVIVWLICITIGWAQSSGGPFSLDFSSDFGLVQSGCTSTTCPMALPSGYLTTSGNQFVNNLTNVRPACAKFDGTPNDGSMPAIRTAGFNCITIDWRDAYLTASTAPATFDDEFASASWLSHQTWQSGDMWSFVGTAFPNGTGQGPSWWGNPVFDTTLAPVYSNSSGHLNLSLIKTPATANIPANSCNGSTCATVGALINNQDTPGGLVQQFGYHEFSVAVPATPGMLFQWDIECLPATCNDSGLEIDAGIWTNADGTEHVRFWSQANGSGNPVYYETTATDITKQHAYGINWQSDFLTFYIDGTQVAQVPNPGGEFSTKGAFTYFLTSDASYFGYGPSPTLTNLPATAVLDYYRVYQTRPTAAPPIGCNTTSQIATCVSNATTAGLKVLLEHAGNEAVATSNACFFGAQPNGLWYDTGGIAAGGDGCGTSPGTVSPAQFQSDWVGLASSYANNTTVIGAALHHEPAIAAASGLRTTTGGGGGGSGGFTASNGQIFDPNGVAWVARGVNVTIEDACGANTQGTCSISNSQVPLATLQRLFPRVNYVRVANFLEGGYDETECTQSGGCFPGPTSENIAAWVKTLTDVGIRVEFSDYSGNTGNGCRSNHANRYQQVAAFYAPGSTSGFGTPFVTFESQNECFGPGPAIDNWQANVTNNYNAVRASNPKAQFTIGTAGGNFTSTYEFSSQFLSPFSNVIIDTHAYAGNPSWCNGCSQASTDTTAAGFISAFKSQSTSTETDIPVISGEYGNSANPAAGVDPDGIKAVTSIYHIMSTGSSTTTSNGAAFWLWICGQPYPSTCTSGNQGDQLTTGGPSASIFNDSQNYGSTAQSLLAAAPGSGPTPASGSGGGGTNPACTVLPSADSCSLSQAQATAVANAINTQQTAEVPAGECFAGPNICYPQNFLVGDIIISTAAQQQLSGNIGSLTDKNGDVWTLQGNQACQGNPGAWWWGGIAKNGVQQWCGYSIAIRKLASGDVWVEEAKKGGWWDMTAAGGVIGNVPKPSGFVADPGAGPNNASSGSGGGPATVTWGGGGTNSSDVLQMCSTVGAAINAANSGLVIFCPGLINSSAQSTLLSGAAKPADCLTMQDLSSAGAHPMTGFPANKMAYDVDFSPRNVMGTGCVDSGATLPADLNAYFGYLEVNNTAPVMNMAMGCSCDGTNGNSADDNAWGSAITQYMNGQASGGPTFTGLSQPMAGNWIAWYYPQNVGSGFNPNGILQANNTTLNPGQQTWWSTLLFTGSGGGGGVPQTTWNPNDKAAITLTNNNLTATTSTTTPNGVRSTTSKTSGLYCWAVTASTIQPNWVSGVANSAWTFAGGTANSIDFVPGSNGKQAVYTNNVLLSGGSSSASASGEEMDFCANFNTHLFYVSSPTMVSVSGAGSWNNSNTCDPTVAACGLSFSGMGSPYFAMFYDPAGESGAVAVLNTTGPFVNSVLSSLPSGYSTWDAAVTATSKSPITLILGANDNFKPASNDNWLLASNRSYK